MNALSLSADTRGRRALVVASPVVVLAIGRVGALLASAWLGRWAWVLSSLIYWGSCVALILALGEKGQFKRWFRRSQGSRWWIVPSLLMGLISFPLLLIPNLGVLADWPLAIAWLGFGAINAVCEEIYWRGFLLDQTAHHLPRGIAVAYSTVLFTAIHPLMLGVFSDIQRFDPTQPLALLPFLIIVVAIGVVYSLIYLRTKSLRLAILSHFLSDLGNLSIFLFMNIVTM